MSSGEKPATGADTKADEPSQVVYAEGVDGLLRDGEVARVVHTDGTVDLIDAKAIGGDLEVMPKGYFLSANFICTLIAQCLASICAYLGWVLPANTLMLINAELGPSANISWVATLWTMGSSIGFLLVGRLSDMYGRRWIVLGTTVLGLIGCILGSTAQNVEMLIAANLCNGIAAAGQLSFGIFIGELVPNKLRGPVITLIFLSSLPFAVFGPVIARTFFENTASKWRWSYFLGDILGVIALVLYWFFYHPPTYDQLHVQGKTVWQTTMDLDFVGIFLYVSGCVLFLIGLSWGGVAYPWASPQTLCTLLIGVALVAAFIVYEGHFCKVQPLMPPRMFRNIGFSAIVTIATIGSMVYYSLTVLWPVIIGSIYTTDSMEIGWQSSVVGGGMLLGQSIAGFCISYVPKVKYQTITASAISLAFMTSMITISEDRWAVTIALGTVVCTAIGFVENISFPGVTLLWEAQDIGLATGILGSIRGMGGAVAQALYGSVLNNELAKRMPEAIGQAATEAGLPESSVESLLVSMGAGDFSAVPGITDSVISAVTSASKMVYTESFRMVFYTTIPFSVVLLLSSILVPNMEKYLSQNVAKKLQSGKPEKMTAAQEAKNKVEMAETV
ncbi:trichothecene efflux pump [Sodiomyces alkalinus F11]|uniref:Trichothecene efflux pump n=1 Tax=Sodiomyces alkalinus (strain CBS 110278 / VKM F-3762 / F11) TaxID=1314773 RepID=A0A3N2Q516_SODAK|nr:trichothecene efflux pump [Sodiomyces alkalinus F11]ROT41715.1 trichothecene efflux pump [Sodiomyces alkalinus F11]